MHCVPSGPKPKLSRRKELCVSNYSPSLPRACPKPPLWIVCLPKSAHVRSGIAQPCSGAVMGIARLPAAAKAEVRSYHLPWAGSCITSTSQPEKALPPQGKCWGLGLAHQPSLPFGFNLRGKEKKQTKKRDLLVQQLSKEFCTLGSRSTLLGEHREVSPSNTCPSRSAVVVGRAQTRFSKLQSLPLFGFERQFLLSPS